MVICNPLKYQSDADAWFHPSVPPGVSIDSLKTCCFQQCYLDRWVMGAVAIFLEWPSQVLQWSNFSSHQKDKWEDKLPYDNRPTIFGTPLVPSTSLCPPVLLDEIYSGFRCIGATRRGRVVRICLEWCYYKLGSEWYKTLRQILKRDCPSGLR